MKGESIIISNSIPSNYILPACAKRLAALKCIGRAFSVRTRHVLATGFSDVTDTVRYQSLMSLWELIRHKTPVSLWNRITLTASDRRTNLQYLRTSKPRIKLTTDSWRQQSIIDWNKLPLAARTQLCKNKFRSSAWTWDANNVPIRAGIRLFLRDV